MYVANARRGANRDDQLLENSSELKSVGRADNRGPTAAPYKARSGGEHFREQR